MQIDGFSSYISYKAPYSEGIYSMKHFFSHSFRPFLKNILLTKKTGLFLLLFLFAYAFGTGIGFLDEQFRPQADAESVTVSAEWNLGLSFQEDGQPPVANASFEELAQYDAYYAQDTDEKIIYLTFDCGYENGNTGMILDALKKHGVSATFFVVGTYIESEPELIKRMVEEGHTVGNHTWHHPDMSQIASIDSFQKELEDVENAYKQVTGEEMTKYYRPPQGKFSETNLQMAKELGYKTFFWSLAYVDWYDDDQPTKKEAFDKLLGRIRNTG